MLVAFVVLPVGALHHVALVVVGVTDTAGDTAHLADRVVLHEHTDHLFFIGQLLHMSLEGDHELVEGG